VGGGSVANRRATTGLPESATTRAPFRYDRYTPQPVSRRPLGCLIEIAETLVLTLVIFWLIQTFVAQPYRVEQDSMRNTLMPDQYVLVDKLTPNFDSYSRGDIVVFHPVRREESCDEEATAADAVPFIKRVIGVPGDTVGIDDGAVFVNGVEIEEPYVLGTTSVPDGAQQWVVPAGRLFVMGDNRNNSTDSRSQNVGQVCARDVIGRAWLRYWPISDLGILQTPTYPGVPAAPSPSAGPGSTSAAPASP
jgi:signal peptidase I